MSRVYLRTIFLAAAAVTSWAVTASPVFPTTPALAKCQPGRSDNGVTYQDGWSSGPYGAAIGGVRADIYEYSPWVQPNRDPTTAWTMLEINSTNVAQVGWQEASGGVRNDFWEYIQAGVPEYHKIPGSGQPIGTVHNYQVLYNNTPGQFTLWIDGNQVGSRSAGFTPTVAVEAGETKTLASQMPGAVSNNETFNNAYYWFGGGWTAFNGALYIQPSSASTYFGNVVSNIYEAQIWDKACYS